MESIDVIESYISGISENDFFESGVKQDAVMRRLEIIGEAVKNLPPEFKNKYPEIAWNKAMGTRNILIHQYFGVDLEIVWYTVVNSIPEFKKQIMKLVDKKD